MQYATGMRESGNLSTGGHRGSGVTEQQTATLRRIGDDEKSVLSDHKALQITSPNRDCRYGHRVRCCIEIRDRYLILGAHEVDDFRRILRILRQ